MDIFTREVVGWSISTRHTTELIVDAFLDALETSGKPAIAHTDQGSEYQSQDYRSLVLNLGTKLSMSAKASPWENAYQESFYDNFKTDLGLEFEGFEAAGEFIEAIHRTIWYYNQQRIHTKLKMPPARFKSKYLAKNRVERVSNEKGYLTILEIKIYAILFLGDILWKIKVTSANKIPRKSGKIP